MINDELGMILEEVVVTYFETLSQYLPAGTEEPYEEPLS
jgi:hypothetical protein